MSPEVCVSTIAAAVFPPTARLRARLHPTAAGLALAWNLFGVVQFLESLRSTPDSLMQMGLSPEQAAVMSSSPAWMTAAFAVGVWGGVVGSALLLLRRGPATGVLAASLAGYIVLFIGDVTEGVFAALGAPQVAILTLVVGIATALLAWSRRVDRQRR
jgi:hypothetical protein